MISKNYRRFLATSTGTSINSDIYVYVTEELDENPSLVQNRIYKFEWINETFQNQQLMNKLIDQNKQITNLIPKEIQNIKNAIS